ncbi:MAG: hypothetical protein EBZ24_02645 [Synechococcaceae bacterium WB9_4xB_025]|nr:hypothetical protein [Synechococcaceae bacterium WB9_4xB_025]
MLLPIQLLSLARILGTREPVAGSIGKGKRIQLFPSFLITYEFIGIPQRIDEDWGRIGSFNLVATSA